MLEKKPLYKISGVQILKSLNKGETLRQLAQDYNGTFENFINQCQTRFGQEEWQKIQRMDQENEIKNKQREEQNTLARRKRAAKKKELEENLAILEEKYSISRAVYTYYFEKSQKVNAELEPLLQRKKIIDANLEQSDAELKDFAKQISSIKKQLQMI